MYIKYTERSLALRMNYERQLFTSFIIDHAFYALPLYSLLACPTYEHLNALHGIFTATVLFITKKMY